jgi:hypothetical protein
MFDDSQLEKIIKERILANPDFALKVYIDEHEAYQRMIKQFRILRQGLIECGYFKDEEEINNFINGLLIADKLNE